MTSGPGRVAGAALALATVLLAGCACLHPASGRTVKYCGRDYGDRIHWLPVPKWFTAEDCAKSNDGALTSDLYLGCYAAAEGLTTGPADLQTLGLGSCRWGTRRH